MITHLQETWKIQNKLHIVPLYTAIPFQVDKIFSWSFNIKLSKISRMNRQKSRIVDLKSTVNQFNIFKIYIICT